MSELRDEIDRTLVQRFERRMQQRIKEATTLFELQKTNLEIYAGKVHIVDEVGDTTICGRTVRGTFVRRTREIGEASCELCLRAAQNAK